MSGSRESRFDSKQMQRQGGRVDRPCHGQEQRKQQIHEISLQNKAKNMQALAHQDRLANREFMSPDPVKASSLSNRSRSLASNVKLGQPSPNQPAASGCQYHGQKRESR